MLPPPENCESIEIGSVCYVHLGAYDDGPTRADIGLTQPPRGSANSILQQTASEKPTLHVGDVSVVRESSSTVESVECAV